MGAFSDLDVEEQDLRGLWTAFASPGLVAIVAGHATSILYLQRPLPCD